MIIHSINHIESQSSHLSVLDSGCVGLLNGNDLLASRGQSQGRSGDGQYAVRREAALDVVDVVALRKHVATGELKKKLSIIKQF